MCLLHVGQGIALVDLDSHSATENARKQVVGGLLQLRGGHGVGEHGGTGNKQGALVGQRLQVQRLGCTGGIAETHHQAPRPEAVQRNIEGILTHAVIHHRHLLAAGNLQHPLHHIFGAVIDDMRKAMGQCQLGFLL